VLLRSVSGLFLSVEFVSVLSVHMTELLFGVVGGSKEPSIRWGFQSLTRKGNFLDGNWVTQCDIYEKCGTVDVASTDASFTF